MQKRMAVTVALALVLAGVVGLPRAAAQATAKEGEPQLKPMDSYTVEFTVNELDNGKKINARSYSMQVRADAIPKWTDTRHLRVGSQVPIPSGGSNMSGGTITWQYHDVGMNIDCRLMPMDGTKVAIYTGWEYSSLGSELVHDTQAPIMHHVNSQVDAIALLGKPTVISEVDDVASTHRYVFEVKVTKINP